ncbi:universal stress protein [Pedobacter sp.]|uniref:universal stress protein n=1 Tax=Pedobacter sp. TaxID=1411316 RepID=UPI003C60A365
MKNNIKNILIPIDLTDAKINALNTAIQMAKRHKSNLHLLHIKDIGTHYPGMGQVAKVTTMMDEVWKKDKAFLEKLTTSITKSHNLNCSLHSVTGNRPAMIVKQSALLQADITVLGIDPNISEQTYLTDSLPYKVLRETAGHLLTVPAGKSVSRFKKIIFLAFSQENPINKLRISKSIIDKNDAQVAMISPFNKKNNNLLNSIREFSGKLKSRLNTIERALRQQSVDTLNGTKDLITLSKKEDAQLIIVEADIKRNLKEFFFGNFTQKMIRNTEVPVLFVKDLTAKSEYTNPLNVAYENNLQFGF